jgi:hypothetical protein
MASESISCDEAGIPRLIQSWYYKFDESFCVALWNGKKIYLDKWQVRDYSLIGIFKNWTSELDGMALDLYIRDHRELYV